MLFGIESTHLKDYATSKLEAMRGVSRVPPPECLLKREMTDPNKMSTILDAIIEDCEDDFFFIKSNPLIMKLEADKDFAARHSK